MATSPHPVIDREKLNAFVGRTLGDLGALTNAVCRKSLTRSGQMARWFGTSIMAACSAVLSAYSAPRTIMEARL